MKKVISLLLVIVMLFTMVPASVFAAETISVKLVSFMRGDVTDLRSSELLEVQVEGYEGNPRELTYKWTSSLGTYLYIYNSHNMYGINNTSGEIEIHNTDKNLQRLSNVPVERGFDKTFSGVGFAWASVYGAYSKSSALSGTVTVEVFDKNGKSLGSDSFSNFYVHNLDADLDNVVIGLFEGDKKNALDLLGESGVVHITCTASKVSSASFKYGNEYVKVTQESTDVDKNGVLDYYIEGVNAGSNSTSEGDAKLNITIKKGNCKFHKDKSGTAEPVVFVFKKPKTSTTTTTLTLIDDIDDRCEYFIDGNKGEKQPDGTIIFTGLTPNTNYTVEVRAEYKDGDETKYVYGYVDDTTKPVYRATVKTYLDGVITDISAIHGDDVTLYLHEDNATADYIELIRSGVGTYTAAVENGIYYPWHIEAGDHYHQARDYKIIIENANGELNLHHYSVAYDTNGGAFKSGEEVAKENFASSAAVNATNNVPVREGYIFIGWEYDGKIISSGAQITPHIVSPITLKARWEKAVNVTINVTINHQADGGYDHNEKREELTVEFLEKTADSPAFVETGDKLFFTQDIVKDENGNAKPYKYSLEEEHLSRYTATNYTYTALLESSTFGVAVSKSGYDVGAIEKKQDKLGNWVINIPLKYNPDDFDLEFSVEMDKDVPKELYPDAVIIKIACWDTENKTWTIISQQRTTDTVVKPGVRVDIDPETGEGKGSYPVWKHDANNNAYGYRAVVAGFIYKDSVVVVPTEKDHVKDENTVIITYTDGNYTATMGDIADGKKYSTSLNGAYYNDKTDAQQGALDGVITVEKYNVTFDAKGGKVNGKDKDVAGNQYYIPSFSGYQPTMNEHNFLGWYTDEECTIPATEGEILTEDITLYAKWDRILTGTLIVDGYYKDEAGQHIVYEKDRAKYALVELEEITNDGTYNIAGQTVEIDWTADEHSSNPVEYKFTGLDPDKTYRIAVYLVNYEDAYQNSTTAKDSDDDIHNDYNETDYEAVYPANAYETYVNTFLHFVPEVYFQNVEVDATAVGEGFRPTNALVKYLAKEVGAADYSVIVQHNSAPYGVQVGMTAGGVNDGVYGCEVWKKVFNGNLYDYQANLTKLDGKALADWPVIVLYGDSVRWSPYNQAPTDALKVVIIPRHYQIVFNWNDGSSYKEIGSDYHIWSYESTVDGPEPVRKGYTFKGWYSNPECTGDAVTTIAADVATDTELYAKWEKNSYGYTVNYLEEGTGKVLAESKNATANYGDSVTENAVEIKGYILADDNSKTMVIDTENNVINFYYTVGSYGYTVNYLEKGTGKVLAGSKNATANYGDSVTETAVEIKGYTLADDNSKTIVIDTENNVINFYYTVGSYGYTVNYLEKGTGKVLTEPKNATANYGDSVTETAVEIKGYTLADDNSKTIVIDTENNVINFYYTVNSYGYIVNYLEEGTNKVLSAAKTSEAAFGEAVTETAIAIDGYALITSAKQTITIAEEGNVINFYYTADKIGGGNGDSSDGIPDKYQKKVFFRVVNGTWEDGTTENIVKILALMKGDTYAIDGTAKLDAPKNMKPDAGYGNGEWSVTPPTTVKGTDIVTYTYTFEKKAFNYEIGGSDVITMYEEETVQSEIKLIPDIGIDPDKLPTVVKYESADESIAKVDQNGKITGVKKGRTTVTATLSDGNTYTIVVIVKERETITVVFGKTEGIGWYRVSQDGGATYQTVFGNSTIEVKKGAQLIIKAGDLMGDAFTFYVNGNAVTPDENNSTVVTVDGYMLIGALGIPVIVPDVEESLNWFQKIIKAIKDFFAKLFGKK